MFLGLKKIGAEGEGNYQHLNGQVNGNIWRGLMF